MEEKVEEEIENSAIRFISIAPLFQAGWKKSEFWLGMGALFLILFSICSISPMHVEHPLQKSKEKVKPYGTLNCGYTIFGLTCSQTVKYKTGFEIEHKKENGLLNLAIIKGSVDSKIEESKIYEGETVGLGKISVSVVSIGEDRAKIKVSRDLDLKWVFLASALLSFAASYSVKKYRENKKSEVSASLVSS